ncbi:MAG: cytochrome P450 [Caulobacterales bacterium]
MNVQNKAVAHFHDGALLAEPFEFFAKLRAEAPVTLTQGPNGAEFFMVTSADMIEEATRRNEDFSNKMGHLLFEGQMLPEVVEILAQVTMPPGGILTHDNPQHGRYRVLVNSVFTKGRIANLAPVVERITDEIIDDFIEAGECDFVNQFAVLLPTYIIADILGLPRDKYSQVRQWSDGVIRIVSRMGSKQEEIDAAHMVISFRRFILSMIAERRKDPQDDLISSLINARHEGVEPLRDDEIGPIAMEIAVAGNETTRNTLMSTMARFIKNPSLMEELKNEPDLITNAVEEMLRYETPATAMWRIAAHDPELGGVAIPAGSAVLLRFDAGNRDPQRFENPDVFDMHRKNAKMHMAFGAPGMHRCLGQMLARKELAIAFPKLLDRLKNLRIIAEGSDTHYWPGLLHRGITSLRIGFDPGPRVYPAA